MTTWASNGTISLTNGSSSVTGSGTSFTLNIQVGSCFVILGTLYEVASITDDTHLTFATAYTGTTGSGISYRAFPTQALAQATLSQVTDLITTFGPLRNNVTVSGGVLTFAANVSGNAGTATKLATARTISLTGDATASMSFDGSANATSAITLAASGVTAGTYKSVTVDAKGRVTAGTNPTTLSGYGITDALSLSGGTITGNLANSANNGQFRLLTSGNAGWRFGHTTTGSTLGGFYIQGTTDAFATSFINAISSDASGNLTFGGSLTGPTASLTGTSGVGNLKLSGAGGSWFWLDNPTATTLRFSSGSTAGTNPMVYDSNGNLGVGTTSPFGYGAGYQTVHVNSTSGGVFRSTGGATTADFYADNAGTVNLRALTNHPIRIVTNNAEVARFTAAGKVGIGTSSPSDVLHIAGTSAPAIRVSDATSYTQMYTNGGTGVINNAGTGSLQLWNNGSERVRIDSSGNVGVGATTVDGRLHVNGTNAGAGIYQKISNTSGTASSYAALSLDPGNNGFNTRDAQIRATNNGGNQVSLSFYTANAATPAQALLIDYAGNINVGGSNATAAGGVRYVDVTNYENTSGSSGSDLRLITQNAAGTGTVALDLIKYKNGAFFISNNETDAAACIGFGINGEKMRLTSGGSLGLGLTNPSARLHIVTTNTATPVTGGGTTGQIRLTSGDTTSSSQAILTFGSYDSTSVERHGAGIAHGKDGTWTGGSGNFPGNLTFWTRAGGGGNQVEAVRIDSNQNVGIGTSAPGSRLEAASSGANIITSTSTTNYAGLMLNAAATQFGYIFFKSGGAEQARITADASSNLVFSRGSGAAESMRIDGSGNVGIGTAGPSARLHVVGSGQVSTFEGNGATWTGVGIRNNYGSSSVNAGSYFNVFNENNITLGGIEWWSGTDGSSYTNFTYTPAGSRTVDRRLTSMRIDTAGNVGIGTTSPAAKLHLANNSGNPSINGIKIEYTGSSQYNTAPLILANSVSTNNHKQVWLFNSVNDASNTYGVFNIGQFNGSGTFVQTLASYQMNGDYWQFYAAGTDQVHISSNGLTVQTATGLGYGTGAGGAVTQATSRTTGVTINKPCGAITLFTAAGTSAWTTFTVTNSTVSATDVIDVCQKSGTNLYQTVVTAVAAGSFNISFSALSGTASDAPVFNFNVTKSVTS